MAELSGGAVNYRIKTLEQVQGQQAVTQAEQGKAIAALNVGMAEHSVAIEDTKGDIKEIKTGQGRVTAALYTLATSAILLALSVVLTR